MRQIRVGAKARAAEAERRKGIIDIMRWPEEREHRKQEKLAKVQEQIAMMNKPIPTQSLYADVKSGAKFTVVSYFTLDTGYEIEVKRLVASLQKFDLSYYIEGIKNIGNWQANTQYKARFIRKVIEQIQGPVVFLDADAVVQQYPILFDDLQEDLAAYFKAKLNLFSGTLYLKNNNRTRALLDEWIAQNTKQSGTWEQQVLSDILPRWEGKISIYRLPPTYCQIFDLMKDAGSPVIEHFQASRRFKKAVASPYYGKIAILVPTKGRPESIKKFVNSVIGTAFDSSRIRFYFCIPVKDKNSRKVIAELDNPNIFIIDEQTDGDGINLSKFWNQLYEAARGWGDYFGFFGDDVEFRTKDWDNQVVAEFQAHKGLPWLVRTNDCYQTTMAVLFFTNKVLHDIAGYYLPEYYRNVDMDTHWSHITREAGCHTFLNNVVTYHHSAAIGRSQMDETHKGCRKYVEIDTAKFHTEEEVSIRAEVVEKIKEYIGSRSQKNA